MSDQIVCRVLTGPTASGKTEIGIRLALEMGWHIVCMDSMQIYRRMDIGTAKPTVNEMQGVPHHMLDICEPTDTFTVADYRDKAERIVTEIHEQLQKEVLFIGGTVLYLRAMIHPMGMGQVQPDPELRKQLNQTAMTEEGKREIHRRLERLDPATAARLPLNDIRRVIRAIEVSEATGIPFSRQPSREMPDRFKWRLVSTAMDRQTLYTRIDKRVSAMIQKGLADEVAGLLAEGVPEDSQSMSGLGYKEMIPYIRGQCSLEEAAGMIRTGTRHFAKRQMTFLRKEENLHYICTENTHAYEDIRRILLEGD